MTEQPPSDRFKPEMPQIPGLPLPGSRASEGNPAAKLVIGLLVVLLVVFVGARWAFRPRHLEPKLAEEQPQIEVPSPAPDPSTLLPHATDAAPGIADTAEMAKPWSSKEFYVHDRLTGEPQTCPATAHGCVEPSCRARICVLRWASKSEFRAKRSWRFASSKRFFLRWPVVGRLPYTPRNWRESGNKSRR